MKKNVCFIFVFLGVCTLFLGHTAADNFINTLTITSGDVDGDTDGTTVTPAPPIVFNPNGDLLASGSTTGHVVLWNPETGEAKTALFTNYPNPFNPETWIPYELATPAEVTVDIHSATGQLVRTLRLGHQPAGIYQYRSRAAYWDGRNEVGEPVASGIYFYTLTAGDFTATRKMLIMK